MLDKLLIEEALGILLSGGADFAELFFETTRNGNVTFLDGGIDSVTDNTVSGVGLRAFIGTETVYGSTSDTGREGILRLARSVAVAVGESRGSFSVRLTPSA